jgi:hypothetical protein
MNVFEAILFLVYQGVVFYLSQFLALRLHAPHGPLFLGTVAITMTVIGILAEVRKKRKPTAPSK